MNRKTSRAPTHSLVVNRQDSPTESISGQVQCIYVEAFPPGQRVDYNTLTAAVAEGRRLLFTAEECGKILGFAFTTPLPGTCVHCLEYFAVRQGERGRGTGSILIRTVLSDLYEREHVSGLILEVEAEQEGSKEEQETRRARVAFYRGNGANMIEDVGYFLAPDLIDGGAIAMKLMWLPAGTAPARLSGPRLRACICGIYSQCYGLSLDDPRVASTLRSSGC